MRWNVIISAMAAIMLMSATSGLAQETAPKQKTPPDATIKITGKAVSAGVGISWGTGTLTYQGKDYPISVSGLSVGSVGVTSVTASGNVHNLSKLEDFEGNYSGSGVGAALGGGQGVLAMRNSNGVGIEMIATTKGVSLAAAAGGITLTLKK